MIRIRENFLALHQNRVINLHPLVKNPVPPKSDALPQWTKMESELSWKMLSFLEFSQGFFDVRVQSDASILYFILLNEINSLVLKSHRISRSIASSSIDALCEDWKVEQLKAQGVLVESETGRLVEGWFHSWTPFPSISQCINFTTSWVLSRNLLGLADFLKASSAAVGGTQVRSAMQVQLVFDPRSYGRFVATKYASQTPEMIIFFCKRWYIQDVSEKIIHDVWSHFFLACFFFQKSIMRFLCFIDISLIWLFSQCFFFFFFFFSRTKILPFWSFSIDAVQVLQATEMLFSELGSADEADLLMLGLAWCWH